MNRSSLPALAVAGCLLVAAVAPARGQEEQPLGRRITINVNAVPPRQVLEMIARTMGGRFELDPQVTAPVTIRVVRITIRTALDAVCESVGCRWEYRDDTLRVAAERAPSSTGDKAAAPRRSGRLASGEPVYLIGNGVTAPVPLTSPNPQYTKAARDAKTQGQVDVAFVVLRDGSVSDVRVTRSLSPELDEQAVQTARQWRFTPGTLEGKPVAAQVELQFTFSLR